MYKKKTNYAPEQRDILVNSCESIFLSIHPSIGQSRNSVDGFIYPTSLSV